MNSVGDAKESVVTYTIQANGDKFQIRRVAKDQGGEDVTAIVQGGYESEDAAKEALYYMGGRMNYNKETAQASADKYEREAVAITTALAGWTPE